MKSVERRFRTVRGKNMYWSSYLCFAEAVKNQHFGRQALHRWFNKLVEKDDYSRERKIELMAFLAAFSNQPRATENESIFASARGKTG